MAALSCDLRLSLIAGIPVRVALTFAVNPRPRTLDLGGWAATAPPPDCEADAGPPPGGTGAPSR